MSEAPPDNSAPVPPAPAAGLPWEDQNAGLGSIFPTVIAFLARPLDAFGKMSLTVDLVRPLAYFVAFVLLSVPIGQLLRLFFWTRENSGLDQIPKEILAQAPFLEVLLGRPTVAVVLVLMVIAPVLNLVVLFVWSAIVHGFLMMTGGARGGFGATLRVGCYAQTSGLAVLVPFAGGIIQPVWFLVLQIIGLSQAHRAGSGKAAFAVIVPLALCCGCFVALVVASGLAAGGLFTPR